MAQIALPRQHVTQPPQPAAVGSPLYENRRADNAGSIELIPNPAFSFPQRYDDESLGPAKHASPRPMSLQVYPSARRGSAPGGPRQKSVSALPDFSFSPAGAATTTATGLSPPHSPETTPTTPRPVGHRRGGSEFVGANSRSGGASLLSSSPPKGDDLLLPPPRSGPPAGRRGHAHRRSGAISSHDLTAMMRPAEPAPAEPQHRAGSAPVTPLEAEQFVFGHGVNKSISQPSLRDNGCLPLEDPDTSPQRPISRARVGFSDRVEYIRPLSTISSETDNSMSTVRGHSATGSLSSIVSIGTSATPRMARSPLNTMVEDDSRPSTAGAILDMATYKNPHFAGDLFGRKRPSSAASSASPTKVASPVSPPVPTKRRSFFRLEPRRSDPGERRLPTSASDPALSASLPSPLLSNTNEHAQADGGSLEKVKSRSRKSHRKARRVKSWTSQIISRTGKHSGKSKTRAPTPPVDHLDSSESEDWEPNFDEDNTVVIVAPSERTPKLDTDIASWKPRELKRVDSETMSPVIDLDAALGPFNTPQGSSPRGVQRGFGAHRRALHSAGGMVQSHRRTESAPELVPFELRQSGIGTTSTMADVFEEDEPEEDASELPASPGKGEIEDEVEELKIQLVEAEDAQSGSAINWNFDDGLRIKRTEKKYRQLSSEALSPLQVPNAVSMENGSQLSLQVSPVEVVEDYEEPRTSSVTHSSDSTVTPQLSANESKEHQPMMSMPLPLPQQTLMTPDTFTSSFSSPDFRSSQASFDTPRLGTSASSMTDYRALPSPHFGEPGPELRVSVDDVPSLTSSRSTTTSAMQGNFAMMGPRRHNERSESLSSAPSVIEQRRRKRSSIASLSRLINRTSFNNERSKLSIEQRPQSEYMETTKESRKKHNRLSKLLFWKPKESSHQR